MLHQEKKPATAEEALATFRAKKEMTNQQRLDELLERMAMRYDSVGMCFETSIRLVRCARMAACADEIHDEDASSIVEVLSEAEDIMEVAHLRYLLRDESEQSHS